MLCQLKLYHHTTCVHDKRHKLIIWQWEKGELFWPILDDRDNCFKKWWLCETIAFENMQNLAFSHMPKMQLEDFLWSLVLFSKYFNLLVILRRYFFLKNYFKTVSHFKVNLYDFGNKDNINIFMIFNMTWI